jgi:class 3 adenylate cyclase
MSAMVERHDTIVRSAIEDHDGFVFATGGDAFSAVFRSAQEALAAAVTAQLLITGEDWGEVEPLRVRMGVHTGEAEERDDNYFGPAVNESARLMSAGHGGQILVSETAQRIVGDRLPDGVVLVDLGEHRLKDVDDPIVVYRSRTLISLSSSRRYVAGRILETTCRAS